MVIEMIPYTNTDLPIQIKYDMELMRLLLKAKELYGRYCSILAYQEINPHLVLKPFILQESYKSCELGGNKIAQSNLYYAKYSSEESMDYEDIRNYNRILLNINTYISPSFKLSMGYLNKIHKSINSSKRGKIKEPGRLRTKLSWIGKRGTSIHNADFVPVAPKEIPIAMSNFITHFNKDYTIDKLLEIAISHAQFESIHPYNDANGRLGRILIPIQAYLKDKQPINLFISEALKENEYTYYQKLQDTRKGKWESYLKFFIHMLNTQLENNISKLELINKLYFEDLTNVTEVLKPKNALKVYNLMFSNIVFTMKEMSDKLQIDYQTIRNYTNKLFEKGLIAKHKISKGEYVYTYIKMYNIHVPVEWL